MHARASLDCYRHGVHASCTARYCTDSNAMQSATQPEYFCEDCQVTQSGLYRCIATWEDDAVMQDGACGVNLTAQSTTDMMQYWTKGR
jgi:hypothetical protein